MTMSVTKYLRYIKEHKIIKENLSQLQGYQNVDICILGTEDTNYNFLGDFQGHFKSHKNVKCHMTLHIIFTVVGVISTFM